MTVKFDASPFVVAHGKNPRGFGCWAFGPKHTTDAMKAFFVTGTFAQAKAAAKAHFDVPGVTVVVFVQS